MSRCALECALAIAEGGAGELVVHARTKADGYRPPAHWERIQDIRAAVNIPVIANGEIWNVEDASRCRAMSGCNALMLGRGIIKMNMVGKNMTMSETQAGKRIGDCQ